MASSTTQPTNTAETNKPFSVLFVCLGNICRSPAAEGVITDLVNKRGLQSNLKSILLAPLAITRYLSLCSPFSIFSSIEDILGALERWKFKETLPDDAHKKVKLLCSYCKKHSESEVPDPYYGGPQGFEKVLDLLEDACESLLNSFVA
ncbi:protein-tyrosine phosphatase [Thalictrum thalictroides]|uniref:acid phosphatase n=1 Tax=Thalictrum thalictroides TaxID=46969 RepID=A0A7J6X5S8_THATH|nr:protein-tyrosine phosphatase [Thalictrum thalictroides]